MVEQLIASGRRPEPGCTYPSQTVLMDKDQNTDDLVAQALAAIRSVLEPQHLVLYSCGEACGYGSRARRIHSAQSDLDLLIVTPSPFPDGLSRRQLLQRLYRSLRTLPASKDLVLVTPEE